jgi:hypothetical protein
VTVRAGAVYYLKISPRAENYVIGLAAGMVGQLIEATVSENSGSYGLTPLEESAGVALLRQLKG